MADRIEVTYPNGEIKSYKLDPNKDTVSIGRHPGNDVVIDDPRIVPFHAIFRHQRKPYQLVVMNAAGQTRIGGEEVPANTTRDLRDEDVVELEGYAFALLEANSPTGQARPSSPKGQTGPTSSPNPIHPINPTPSTRPVESTHPASPMGPLSSTPQSSSPAPIGSTPPASSANPTPAISPTSQPKQPDQDDEYITVEMEERERTVDAGQTATYQFTIVNGGRLVANFDVAVEGLPSTWVSVQPPEVNLNEGGRQLIIINILPPRWWTSRAGPYPFVVKVTSPDYRGHVNQRSAALNINPFYEFALSELSPRKMTVTWRAPIGDTQLALTNRGNSTVTYRLEGADAEQKCRFAFITPTQGRVPARQADIAVPPGETQLVPIQVVTAPMRRWLGGEKHYPLDFKATPLAGPTTPYSAHGDLYSWALLLPRTALWAVALLALCCGGSVLATFWSTLFPDPVIRKFDVNPKVIVAGTPVTIEWDVVSTSQVQISNVNNNQPLPPADKAVQTPQQQIEYVLVIPNSTIEPRRIVVFVTPAAAATATPTPTRAPNAPRIEFFTITPNEVVLGSPEASNVRLSWSVLGTVTRVEIKGPDMPARTVERQGNLTVAANRATSFVLTAFNGDAFDSQTVDLRVSVATPTATAVPSGTPTPTPTRTPTLPPGANTPTATATPSRTATTIPLAVTSVTASVSPNSSTTCPTTFNFSATITVNRPGNVTYVWERSDGASEAPKTITFAAAGSQNVADTWTLSANGTHWQRVRIQSPNALVSNQATFTLNCPTVVYDLIANANKASWNSLSPQVSIPFGGSDVDERGFVLWRDNALLNDNSRVARVLETHPKWVANGGIAGTYTDIFNSGYTVQASDRLSGKVGFLNGAGAGNVTFRVIFRVQGISPNQEIVTIPLAYNQGVKSFDVALGNRAGRKADFILQVDAGASAAQDWAVWQDVKITR